MCETTYLLCILSLLTTLLHAQSPVHYPSRRALYCKFDACNIMNHVNTEEMIYIQNIATETVS